jgi:hypothetical protein
MGVARGGATSYTLVIWISATVSRGSAERLKLNPVHPLTRG